MPRPWPAHPPGDRRAGGMSSASRQPQARRPRRLFPVRLAALGTAAAAAVIAAGPASLGTAGASTGRPVVAAATAGPGAGHPRLSVEIISVTPQTARPGGTVTV